MSGERLCLSALFGLSLALSACDDPLVEAQIIEATRVLGARVSVENDAERAWPRPGERIQVSWLVAAPAPAPGFGWAFSACVAAPTTQGVPACAASPFAEVASQGITHEPPAFELVTPEEAALNGAERLLLQGALCVSEQPALAARLEDTRCEGERRLALLTVGIERDTGNRNPTLQDEPISFDGADWPAPSGDWLEQSECVASDAGPSLPLVTAGGPSPRIDARLSDSDREPLQRFGEPTFEELWLSHFADTGRLERALSIIEADSSELGVRVAWRPPRRVEAGKVARFYFVARDLRGGADWIVRTACVVP
ncbi:MAG TPA: hypothetical protein VI072_01070 [Polyangiaceae bacterium]